MTYSKKAFIYFKMKGSQEKILCALVSCPESRNKKNDPYILRLLWGTVCAVVTNADSCVDLNPRITI